MNAYQKNARLQLSFRIRGMWLSEHDCNTLRRAELTLHRWHELECGDGNANGSWAIERDDNGDGKPFMVHHRYSHSNGGKDTVHRIRIADREAGAIRRVKEVCDRLGIFFYVQADPRGGSLYVSNEPLTDQNYTNGVYCGVE